MSVFNGWNVGDKIAAILAVIGLFQFIALLLTYFIMRDTARRQLRAYISVDENKDKEGRKLKLESNGDIIGIAMAINHGQTPAHDLHTNIGIGCVKSPLDPEFNFPEIIYLSYPEGGVLHPNQTHFLKGIWSPPPGEPILTETGFRNTLTPHGPGLHWHIFGFVSYSDVFGDKHYTKFCFQILWENGSENVPGWFVCKQYNETDRDTPRFITRLKKLMKRTLFAWW